MDRSRLAQRLPPAVGLVLWGGAAVLAQLAVGRLYGTLVSGLSYYTGLFLLSGMFVQGIGLGQPSVGRRARALPWTVSLVLAAAWWLGRYNLIAQHREEFQWTLVANTLPKAADFDLHLAVVLAILAAIPLHLLLGARIAERQLALRLGARGYLLTALGGVVGAAVFAALTQVAPSPASVVLVLLGLLHLAERASDHPDVPTPAVRGQRLVAPVVTALAALALSAGHLWSPYQRIDLIPRAGRLDVLSNGLFITTASARPLPEEPVAQRAVYRAAFRALRPGDHVLILGAGTGTFDVREALAAGAGRVTAVEIEPTFVRIGRAFDPDQTYDDPRVSVHVQDARRHLSTTRDTFDLIYLPFLDSQTGASAQARFRLDSFLYTQESLRRAWTLLAPDGLLALNFCTATPWIQARLFATLRAATGADVRAYQRPGSCWSLFIASKGRPSPATDGFYTDVTAEVARAPAVRPATDDWPFLYNERAAIPLEHTRLLVTLAILFAALAGWGRAAPTEPPPLGHAALTRYAALSGAAFFFLELRAIAAITPIAGATHLAQSTVVGGIILASLAGSWIARRRAPRTRTLWLLLALGLAAAAAGPSAAVGIARWPLPHVIVILVTMLAPTFLAGMVYMNVVRGRDDRTVVGMQRANLLGGAVGGLAEVSVVALGFARSLTIAAAAYGLAGLALWLARHDLARASAPSAGATPPR